MLVGAVALPLLSGYAQTPVAQAPPSLSPATAEVVRLAEAGTSEDVILAYIQNSEAVKELFSDVMRCIKRSANDFRFHT